MSLPQGAHFNNISWPSLYSPAKEVGFVGPAIRPGGYYLSHPDGTSRPLQHPMYLGIDPILDVFKFTLYWTLIFHLPFNFIAGIYAFFNFLFPPARNVGDTIVQSPAAQSHSHPAAHPHLHTLPPPPVDEWLKPPRVNARRSRLTFALLVLFTFLGFSLLSAVVGAAVLAFVLVGVYRAGEFYMSTYVPPFLFLISDAVRTWF